MFLLKVVLAAVAMFVMASTPASSEPITIALFGAAFAATTLGSIVTFGIGLAVTYGVSLIQKALAPTTATEAAAGVSLDIEMGDDTPISFVAGKFSTAGKRKYSGVWGEDGKTTNAYFTDVIEVGSIPNYAGARGLNSIWIDDKLCDILWDEPSADGRGYPVSQYRVGTTPKDFLWIKFLDGTQTVADPYLISKFGTDVDRPFLSTMIGLGCQVVILTARFNTDLFSGSVPAGLYEPAPVPLYDLRKDSTNGGSGSHRWGNPLTYEQSINPATITYNIIRGVYYGSEWVYGGQNLAAFRLPASNWIAAANACDALVELDDGTFEAAYRAGYEFHGDEKPSDAIEKIRASSNARLAEVGGIFKILIGAPGAAVYGFTDDDILVTESQTYTPFPNLDDTVNGIEATYPEPAEKWASKNAPARYSPDLEIEDGNRRLAVSVTFEAVPFANQIQRLMLAMIQEDRRFRRHQFYLPPDAYPLEPNDVVSYTSARNGYNNKKFLVVTITGPRSFNQLVTLKEIDPSDYDWNSGFQLPISIGWIGPITANPQPMYGWQVQPATLDDSDGVPWRPTIQISCAPDQDDVAYVWVKVRLAATQDIVFDSQQTTYGAPYSWKLNANFKGKTDYEAEGKFVPFSNRQTEWSDWLPVTTPDISTDDLLVDLGHIKKDIQNVFNDIFGQLDDTRSLVEQISVNQMSNGAVSNLSNRHLEVTVDNNKAEFDETISVVVDELNATVSDVTELTATVGANKADANAQIATVAGVANAASAATTTLSATVGANSANGQVRFSVAANQTGAVARYSIAIRAGTTSAYVESGMFLEIYDSGGGVLKSRFSVLADQFSVLNPDGSGQSYLPMVFEAGILKLALANIGDVTAGVLHDAANHMVIDLANATILISD